MRVPQLRQAILAGACVLIWSCSYDHAGPTLPEGATSAEEASPATPPPVSVTQPSVPAASTYYPTGHPSLRPSSSVNPPSTSTARPSAAPAPSPVVSANSPHSAPVLPPPPAPAPDDNPAAGASADQSSDSNFDNLEIIDASLKGKLAVLRVGSEPTANNLLSVFAGLKNKTSHALPLEVQTVYKDKLGNPLNDGGWIPLTLKPHEETEYRSASISADAADFLVRIRKASPAANSEAN